MYLDSSFSVYVNDIVLQIIRVVLVTPGGMNPSASCGRTRL
jgi:hypothetical protein